MSGSARPGQVYQSEYGVQYHVLATYEGFAWVLLLSSQGLDPPSWRAPRTETAEFLQRLELWRDVS